MAKLSQAELLNFAIENGIVDINTISKQFEMNERKKYLEMHKYEIWQGEKDKKWYTYLPDEEKGRRLIKRLRKEDLEEEIIKFYKSVENEPTIKKVFEMWSDEKLRYKEIQKQSYDRYHTDFDRFFVNNKVFPRFSERKISYIDENELEEFIRLTICELELTEKAYSGLRILINGIFKYAKKKKFSSISISGFMGDLELPKRIFKKILVDPKDKIYQEEEAFLLTDYLRTQTEDLACLGLLLTFETGVRVGELSALKPDAILKYSIKIRRTEVKYKDENGKWKFAVKELTKTDAGYRDIIIISKAEETLNNIFTIRENGEYLFTKNGKRIKSSSFRRKLESVCKHLGIDYKSNHKIRATYATTLLNENVDDVIVADQMGHVDVETTRRHYYYSNKSDEKKIKQINAAVSY